MSAMHNPLMRGAIAAVSVSLLGAVGCTVQNQPPPRQAYYYESSTPPPPPPAARYRTPPPPPTTEVWVDGHRADRVNGPPNGWRNSPRVAYQGSQAYYVNGRWYYQSSVHGWVVMRDEPAELARARPASVGAGPQRVHGYLADRTNRPQNVLNYPRVPYGDSYAYLIGGRWYYKVNDQYWVVFREEPRDLTRRRAEINRGTNYPYPR